MMLMKRTFAKILHGKPTLEGAGVHLKRGFGFYDTEDFDPFLLFDDFSNTEAEGYKAGFPQHPHRGMETVTYLLKGEVVHRDNLGNAGSIGAGAVQWMSAGSGIVHEEMPQVHAEGIQGFQLWVNLPQIAKMSAPQYQDIRPEEIPTVASEGSEVKVIAGEYQGVKGPVSDISVHPTYFDITLVAEREFSFSLPAVHTLFIYVIEGDVVCRSLNGEQWVRAGDIGLMSLGDEFEVYAGNNGARFLLVSGAPLNEPIAWGGPIVMNTEAELKEAFAELQNGTFVKN